MIRPELLFSGIAALAVVAGAAAVAWRREWSVRAVETLVALAAGFMIAAALLDMLPEAIRRGGAATPAIALLGYALVHLTQHTLAPHFHFGEETHRVSRVVSHSALAGLMLHTFVDGVAIASGFLVSQALGILIFTAIVLHKLPEGLAVSSLYLAAGSSRRAALLAACALGAATIAGALLTDYVGPLRTHGLALSAGVTLYVAASNLVPEFQHERGLRLPGAFFVGAIVYLGARQLAGL